MDLFKLVLAFNWVYISVCDAGETSGLDTNTTLTKKHQYLHSNNLFSWWNLLERELQLEIFDVVHCGNKICLLLFCHIFPECNHCPLHLKSKTGR